MIKRKILLLKCYKCESVLLPNISVVYIVLQGRYFDKIFCSSCVNIFHLLAIPLKSLNQLHNSLTSLYVPGTNKLFYKSSLMRSETFINLDFFKKKINRKFLSNKNQFIIIRPNSAFKIFQSSNVNDFIIVFQCSVLNFPSNYVMIKFPRSLCPYDNYFDLIKSFYSKVKGKFIRMEHFTSFVVKIELSCQSYFSFVFHILPGKTRFQILLTMKEIYQLTNQSKRELSTAIMYFPIIHDKHCFCLCCKSRINTFCNSSLELCFCKIKCSKFHENEQIFENIL